MTFNQNSNCSLDGFDIIFWLKMKLHPVNYVRLTEMNETFKKNRTNPVLSRFVVFHDAQLL